MDVRVGSPKKQDIAKALAKKRFGFGYFENSDGRDEYGIVLYDDAGQNLHAMQTQEPTLDNHSDDEGEFVYDAVSAPMEESGGLVMGEKRHVVPFIALSYPWRIAFALFLLGLFIVVLYYHVTVMKAETSGFTSFMNGQTFGVRFFFSGMGVTITFCWIAFFVSTCHSSLPALLPFPTSLLPFPTSLLPFPTSLLPFPTSLLPLSHLFPSPHTPPTNPVTTH
jgi:hypothetical protein